MKPFQNKLNKNYAAFLVGLLLLLSQVGFSATYYWVGNSGNWSDLSHWSTTSGGMFSVTSIPSNVDDVIFDNNSFNTSNQLVNVDITSIIVNSLTWNVNNSNPSFLGQTVSVVGMVSFGTSTMNSFVTRTLNVGGALSFSNSNLNFFTPGLVTIGNHVTIDNSTITTLNPSTAFFNGNLMLNNSTITNFTVGTISGTRVGNGGMVVRGNLNFGNSIFGTYSSSTTTIYGDLIFGNSIGTFTYGAFTLLGSFSAGNNAFLNPIFCFDATTRSLNYGVANFFGTAAGLYIDLKNKPLNGTVTINNTVGDYSLVTGLSCDKIAYGTSFNRGGTITVSGNVNTGANTINARVGIVFNTSTTNTIQSLKTTFNTPIVIVNGSAPAILGTFNISTLNNNTNTIIGFKKANFITVAQITGNNSFDSLVVYPNASTLSLGAGQTQQINQYFSYRGTSCFPSFLQSNAAGQQANIKLGNNVSFASDYLSIKDINVNSTGAGFYIGTTSTNSGNNTNIAFNSPKTNVYGSLGPDIKTCLNSITLNTNQFNNNQTVNWSNSSTTPFITVSSSGDYFVNILFNSGCTYKDTINIEFLTNPTVTISGLASVSGFQQGVIYNVTSLAGFDYQWTLPMGCSLNSLQGFPTATVNFNGFSGGTLTVTGTNSITNCSSTAYLNITKIVLPRYFIPSQTIYCGTSSGFCVPISTLIPVSPNTIGLDFELIYDPTLITATGLAALGSVATSYGNYSLNIAIPGKVIASLYLDNPPVNTYMTGTGDLLCIGFKVKNNVLPGQLLSTFSSSTILESTYLSTSTVPAVVSGSFNYSRSIVGALNYQSTSTRIPGGLGQNPTQIQGYDLTNSTTTGASIVLDNTGKFQIFDLGAANIKVSRDVAGDANTPVANCANAIAAINSTDRLMASQISNGIISTPTIYQLLAADVNLDGKITAGDATLISMRTVNAFNCEFPQAWNYQLDPSGNLIPKANYQKSLDWIFLDRATLTTPAFLGASKSNVPPIPAFLPITSNRNTPCNGLIDQTISGILLGDVNSSWSTLSGVNLRTSSNNNTVVLHLDSVIYEKDGSLNIPISYESDEAFTGLDFVMNYDSATIEIVSIQVTPNADAEVDVLFNNIKGAERLFATSFIKQSPIVSNNSILHLKIRKPNGKISKNDFLSIDAYLNGDFSNVRIDEVTNVTGYKEDNLNDVVLFPNPTTGEFSIDLNSKDADFEITSMFGNIVRSGRTSGKVDISNLEPGIYNFTLIASGNYKNFKVIKL